MLFGWCRAYQPKELMCDEREENKEKKKREKKKFVQICEEEKNEFYSQFLNLEYIYGFVVFVCVCVRF